MLVFGDATRRERCANKLARVADALDRSAAAPAGLRRHSLLVEALIESGELAQGIADRDFHAAGDLDRAAPDADAALASTMAIARRCAASWSSRFAEQSAAPALQPMHSRASWSDGDIEVKQPEGYAFYALYPESYFVAAQKLADGRRWQVLGVRSIGTSLACMVAAGLGAAQPITVRPVGDPFARRIACDPERIDRAADAYALVDEGPGLSGSSLAAVARWLLDAGVPEERLHIFAAHRRGPGSAARDDVRALWQRAQAARRVHVATFDDVMLHAAAPEHGIETWVASLLGPLDEPLREIGGGAWRELQPPRGVPAPVHPWQERRKFLARAGGRRWLVKFNGLGATGERKLAKARVLGAAGFTSEPLGACHGFIVERWRDDALPWPALLSARERSALLERVAAYLAFRARRFRESADAGASIGALAAMGRQNSEEALGRPLAIAWSRWSPHEATLASLVRRVATDNRMHAWEWLCCPEGFLKTDAIDHHAGHDLIGCQDIAWDVAGAAAELDLDDDEALRLAADVGALAGAPGSEPLVRFFAGCYPAFQLGHFDDAARSAGDATEAALLGAARARYAGRLRRVLESPAFTPMR